MVKWIRNLREDESEAAAIKVALIAVAITFAIILIMNWLGTPVEELF